MTAHFYVEARQVGEYIAEVAGTDEAPFSHAIDVDDIPTLILHLNKAHRDLVRRRTRNDICTYCDSCQNDNAYHVMESCPVCKPKLDEARLKGLL